MLHRIHPSLRRSQYSPGSIGMGHYSKALLMGNVDQLPNFPCIQTFLCQYPWAVKVHQPRNHNLDKIRTLCPMLPYPCSIIRQILICFPDERSVMSLSAQVCQGGAVSNSIFLCQPPGCLSGSPSVSPIPEVGKSLCPVGCQISRIQASSGSAQCRPIACLQAIPSKIMCMWQSTAMASTSFLSPSIAEILFLHNADFLSTLCYVPNSITGRPLRSAPKFA